MSQERNIPYIAGPPVEQPHRFFGRQEIFEQIIDEFKYKTHTAIALYGPRRIGKTSILKQIPERLGSQYCTIQFDCQSYANKPLHQIIQSLINTMARAARMKHEYSIENHGYAIINLFRERFLPEFYAALGPERHPVLLIDEFDLLDTPAAPLHPPAALDFIEYLQRMVEQEDRLGIILVTGRHPSDLSVHFEPIFKIFRIITVSVLDRSSAEQLVSMAVSDGSLIWEEGSIDRVLDLTGCHPFFTQLLCQSIWRRCYRRRVDKIPRVEVGTVEDEAAEVIHQGHGAFEWSWGQLSPAGRIIWAVMAANIHDTSNTDGAISRQALFEAVRVSGIRVVGSDLNRTPDVLVEADLLYLKANGNYAFRVELMRRWVRQTKPLSILRTELQKLHPHAEALFQIGLGIYEGRTRKRNLREAEKKLHEALLLNPNHVEARILLARVYHENGDSENAIRELEEAHCYDPGAARNARIEILCAYGENLEFQKREDEALRQYEKVLELSEHDRFAQERISYIYTRRGDEARDIDDLANAISYYERAGAQQKIIDINNRIRQRQIDDSLTHARQFERHDDWVRASQIYQRIIETHGDTANNDYAKLIERNQNNHLQRQQYSEARSLMHRGSHAEAIDILKEITQRNPYYLDSAELLGQAVAATRRGRVDRSRQSEDQETPLAPPQKPRSGQTIVPERRNGVFILHTADIQIISDESALGMPDSAISDGSPIDNKRVMATLLTSSASSGTPAPIFPLVVPDPPQATAPVSIPVAAPLATPAPVPAGVPAPVPAGVPAPVPAGAPTPIPAGVPVPVPAGVPAPVPADVPAGVPVPMTSPPPPPVLPSHAPGSDYPLPRRRYRSWLAIATALVLAAPLASVAGRYMQGMVATQPGVDSHTRPGSDTQIAADFATQISLKQIESLITQKQWDLAKQKAQDLANHPRTTASIKQSLIELIIIADNGKSDMTHYQEALKLLSSGDYVAANSHLMQIRASSEYRSEKEECLEQIHVYVNDRKNEINKLLEHAKCKEIDVILNELIDIDTKTKSYAYRTRVDCRKQKKGAPAETPPGGQDDKPEQKNIPNSAASIPSPTERFKSLPAGLRDPFNIHSMPTSPE